MIMKTLKRLTAAWLALVMVLILSACSCGRQETDVIAERAGNYELTGIVSADGESAPEDIGLMNEAGLTCTLSLLENGSGTLYLFDEKRALSWTGDAITVDGTSYSYTYADNTITVSREGSSLTFQRIKP